MPTNNEDIAWLAGLLEGEGSFGVYPRRPGCRPQVRIALGMRDEDVVRRAKTVSGGVGCRVFKTGDMWTWVVGSWTDIHELAPKLLPYMGERRRAQILRLLDTPKPDMTRQRKHRLSNLEVAKIRAIYADGGMTQRALASRCRISQPYLCRLLSGERRGPV